MKIQKYQIELTIEKKDWKMYQKAGWKKKRERTPEKRKEIYLKQKEKEKEV